MIDIKIVLSHDDSFHFEMYRHGDALFFNVEHEGAKLTRRYIDQLRELRDDEQYYLFTRIVHKVLPDKWNHPSMSDDEKNDVLTALHHVCGVSNKMTKATST